MEIPVLPGLSAEKVEFLAAKLNKIRLGECLKSIKVRQHAGTMESGSREYLIRLNLKDLKSEWAHKNLVNMFNIAKCVATQFSQKLSTTIKMKLRKGKDNLVGHARMSKSKGEMATASEDLEIENDDSELLNSSARKAMKLLEEGVKDNKRSKKGQEHVSYEDEEEEEKEDKDEEEEKENNEEAEVDEDDEEVSTEAVKGKKISANDVKKAQQSSDKYDEKNFSAYAKSLVPLWQRHELISDISYADDFSHIDVRVVIPPGNVKVLMLSIVENVSEVCLVRYTKNINKAVVLERTVKGKTERIVQTHGVNFLAVWQQPEADSSRIKCNDIHQILKTYGVEAARNTITQEISGVFGVYGIAVDNRHLALIADFMTFQGTYLAMNRNCMGARPSVLQKATFETSMKFILDACMRGDTDDLTSPSSAIVLGKPIRSGTNAFTLLQPLQ